MIEKGKKVGFVQIEQKIEVLEHVNMMFGLVLFARTVNRVCYVSLHTPSQIYKWAPYQRDVGGGQGDKIRLPL